MHEPKVVALLAGLAAGVALGILFAPKAGADTRNKLSESLSHLGDSVKTSTSDQAHKLADVINQLLKVVKDNLSDPTDEADADDLEHA